MDATTVAVDVAKTVFEVAIATSQWSIVARHRFNRRQFTKFLTTASPTHVVMEACVCLAMSRAPLANPRSF